MEQAKKVCLCCGKSITGRADKKFCDHYCRNAYNNSEYSDRNNYMRSVDAILRRNRRLLQQEMDGSEGRKKVRREALLQAGFSFRYYTHQLRSRKGRVYCFNYEYGYAPSPDGEWVWLVCTP